MSRRPAFTLIELLTVMGLVGILVAAAAPTYASFRQNVAFNAAGDALLNDLRTAQSNSINAQDGAAHMIHVVNDTTYQVLSGTSVTQTVVLPNGIHLHTPLPADCVFQRLTGLTTANQFVLELGSRQKTVTVDANGRLTQS